MIFRISGEFIKVSKNTNNRFWNPIGMFYNISEIKIEGDWYKCGISYLAKNGKSYIQVSNPMKVDEKTLHIKKVHTQGLYKELEITKLKLNLLKLRLHQHKLNHSSFKIRNTISERRNTIYIFSVATILSVIYFIINEMNSNSLMKYISENNWLQTIIIFITISGFINIFYPFTIKKQIDEKDIERIAKDKYEEEARNKEIERKATL
jgi:hypothetical protein